MLCSLLLIQLSERCTGHIWLVGRIKLFHLRQIWVGVGAFSLFHFPVLCFALLEESQHDLTSIDWDFKH